jgi:hypothetical protein
LSPWGELNLLHVEPPTTPITGRFTSVDPLEGVPGEPAIANPYPYAKNDPLDQVDPFGLSPLRDPDLKWWDMVDGLNPPTAESPP